MKLEILKAVSGVADHLPIRRFCYIKNSKLDFVDFWLCLYIITTGIVCVYSHPLENIPDVYTNLTGEDITSNELGLFALVVGIMNLVRLFCPFKLPIVVACLGKCVMLSVFLLLLFGIVGKPVLPLTSGYLVVAILLSLDNIRRT
jgi:hypothetical protein